MSLEILEAEIKKRRTFAIISHPDAGKTTLTEKLLLYAGMIRTAGMVRGRKNAKAASSDWMEMEKERGISITASAMQFSYRDCIINVLDTPGHQDFSEDTYRTLTAADSAVMVIDAGKGVELQTRKLFTVCRMCNIPILTFINKMDLPGRDPFELMAEVEDLLNIKAAPLNWPIGAGKDFMGVVDLKYYSNLEKLESSQIKNGQENVLLYEKASVGGSQKAAVNKTTLKSVLDGGNAATGFKEQLSYELELLKEAGNKFSLEGFLRGEITPVFFGSALTNFGIEFFFDTFCEIAPAPSSKVVTADNGEKQIINPLQNSFSAYVFKIQANIDARHHDSMAFLRVCSGKFERDLLVKHHRTGKEVRLSRTHSMFGGERNIVDVAFPGDIVGVVNPGLFLIGDTISLEGGFNYKAMPKFPPEVVAAIRPLDVLARKSFDKGVRQLSEEGVVLVLTPLKSATNEVLIAAVGCLQFDVIQNRLENEYRVKTKIDLLPYRYGNWLIGDPEKFRPTSSAMLAKDLLGRVILLYTQEWEKNYLLEQNKGFELKEFV
ncbi:MAG: peptide chain release factor 3 [Deltaproteobacteria bacterium]|jgi:peptide chain release factor 3|nr:peptide chain release factor 3 [Deltaproteobacteria bacterium]